MAKCPGVYDTQNVGCQEDACGEKQDDSRNAEMPGDRLGEHTCRQSQGDDKSRVMLECINHEKNLCQYRRKKAIRGARSLLYGRSALVPVVSKVNHR